MWVTDGDNNRIFNLDNVAHIQRVGDNIKFHLVNGEDVYVRYGETERHAETVYAAILDGIRNTNLVV